MHSLNKGFQEKRKFSEEISRWFSKVVAKTEKDKKKHLVSPFFQL